MATPFWMDTPGCSQARLKEIPKTSVLVFCHKCVDVFETKHKCPAEIVTRTQLRFPSRLLAAKESQSGEAQYFFSDESIEILHGAVDRSGVDGVLCLGVPRVTYDNHKVFAKASKTTVRCFTNLKPDVFDLSKVEGYKFCEFCERYVSNANKHCFMCSACTSKDGSPYKHCELCMRCVKKSYRHCKKCERCHLEGRCFSGEVHEYEEQ
ncbi:hypothetical protein TELCIR_18259 [Teladorsagia circumcincta]|uniref:CTCHY-type domain-containing protein n=1 Tax=Teladorsagia circumcincta TaxID=45464 RepID=A0A2G9TQH1_TELCI|nr:hypothetical protein TELCIR_18259 [Teladorsagia circumcincta]